jgi:hypothetical protein
MLLQGQPMYLAHACIFMFLFGYAKLAHGSGLCVNVFGFCSMILQKYKIFMFSVLGSILFNVGCMCFYLLGACFSNNAYKLGIINNATWKKQD